MAFSVKSMETRKMVILQPAYMPWLGFFDLMDKADVFVVLDDVQYTVRDWRSRNRIKTPDGVLWLTVPVRAKGAREKVIKDVEIDNTQPWQDKHLQSLASFYRKSKHFEEIMQLVIECIGKRHNFLMEADMGLIMSIKNYLSIDTKILFSSEIPSAGEKDEKLLSICKHLNATHYLSGNSAKAYLRETIFSEEGITVGWHDYSHPFYNQLWLKEQGFISHLSVIDLLFNHGPESCSILTGRKIIEKPEGVGIKHADSV